MKKLIYRDKDGEVLNIGEWEPNAVHIKNPDADELTLGQVKKMVEKEQSPEYLYDSDGNPFMEELNPLPEGATSKEEEVVERSDGGFAAQSHYQSLRASEYPKIIDQLDYIYHHGVDKWKSDMIEPIKEKYPKPGS